MLFGEDCGGTQEQGILFEMEVTRGTCLCRCGEKFAIFRGPDGERVQLEQIFLKNLHFPHIAE